MDNKHNETNLPGQMPITSQPISGIGFVIPPEPSSIPMQMIGSPGLSYLATVDQLVIRQKIELLEIAVGFEGNNKYEIFNQQGQVVFTAKENTDCLTRQCCGPLRPFELNILDIYGNDAIALNRPLRCDSCCCPCCLQELEVSAPPGTVVGTIKQNWSCFPSFDIKDVTGTTVLKIKGPFFTISCCRDVVFKLHSMTGEEIGSISKKWSGFLKEAYTDADNFGINFPVDLDVNMKATLLGAAFLIDFMYFEKAGNKN